jgi:hypothetical protein
MSDVTEAHRSEAVKLLESALYPIDAVKGVELIAKALCAAEYRGFAAGRASVTQKAEGWVQMANSEPDQAGWYGLCWVQFDDGSVDEKRPHYHTGNGVWRVVTSDHLQHAKVVAWCRATAPLPPAPADTELKGTP